MRSFDALVAEGESVPVEGWDFGWFEGRATEARPSWGYAGLLAGALGEASSALDVQTGGGEVLAGALDGRPRTPMRLAATESWPPNLAVARRNLASRGAWVVAAADDAPLPFADGSFDLVTSRHPTRTRFDEIARVLQRGGRYLSQQVGAGSVRELTAYLMGPQPLGNRTTGIARQRAEAAGLTVVDLRAESLPMQFFDIAAVVHFLRKVIWIVPGFTVDHYRDRLRRLHEQIERDGVFGAHAERFLIDARKV